MTNSRGWHRRETGKQPRRLGHRRVIQQRLQALVDGPWDEVVKDFEGVGLALTGGVGHVALGSSHQLSIVELGQQAKYALMQQRQFLVDGGSQGRSAVGYYAQQQLRGQAEFFAQQVLEGGPVGGVGRESAQRPQRHSARKQVRMLGQLQ